LAWLSALSTIASGQGSPLALQQVALERAGIDPIRIEQPWSFAALMTSRTGVSPLARNRKFESISLQQGV
jgi:hypothetical protein